MAFSASTNTPATLPASHPGQTNRLFWRWWRKQSPSQQDRYATLGPLVSVLLFLVAIIAAFWYLRNEELEREQESVRRDTEVVQQQIRLRLVENQEQLLRLSREISLRAVTPDQFMVQAGEFVRARPEVVSISWVRADERVIASQNSLALPLDSLYDESGELDRERKNRPMAVFSTLLPPRVAFKQARERGQPVYSEAYASPHASPNAMRLVQLQ